MKTINNSPIQVGGNFHVEQNAVVAREDYILTSSALNSQPVAPQQLRNA